MIAELEEIDRSVESIAASKVPTALLKAGKRYFDSWTNALEAAGYDPANVLLVRSPYTKDEVLGLLRTLAKDFANMRLAKLYEQPFSPAIVRLFGDVETALERAKLRDWPVHERGVTMSKDESSRDSKARTQW